MTGACLPQGADCVLIVEETETLPSGKIKFTGSYTKDNISFMGEDVRKGEVLLTRGIKIRPQEIAVLASAGKVSVLVNKSPSVAVISPEMSLLNHISCPVNRR
jgi:molybdopterin molybdotransferase